MQSVLSIVFIRADKYWVQVVTPEVDSADIAQCHPQGHFPFAAVLSC